jgi:AraC family transcriptional regulator, regulatory protein of adaptative response / methylphosphotriester-DNA alkyltransferase methyltransferase
MSPSVAEPPALPLSLVLPVYRPGTRDARRLLYQDALAIIEREYPSDLRLDGVAARIFTSRRSLQRAFNDAGRSFRGEHLRARLRAAAAAMREDPQRTVRDVSLAVGYRQSAQFAKAFRREFGISPAAYREAAARARADDRSAARGA